MEIINCKICLTPNTRPRVIFEGDKICNACKYKDKKNDVDWPKRKNELKAICNKYRSKTNEYDCIVPWSGGKDSSSVAYKLKFDYGMNPLLVTFSPLIPSIVGVKNRKNFLDMGFDNVYFHPNEKVSRILSKRFFRERGNPKVHWDAGINSLPIQIACEKNIKLVFYAEHGESEYGGRVLNKDSDKIRNFEEVIENQIGDDPQNWVSDEINMYNLQPYIYPKLEVIKQKQITPYYFSYFEKWDIHENYKFIKSKTKFSENETRISGTFQNYDSLDDYIDPLYYYMQFIKFGFGRALRDASRLIRNNHLERDKGLEYVKAYDGEFPDTEFQTILKFLNLTTEEFYKIVDQHRNNEIWEKSGNTYKLKFEII